MNTATLHPGATLPASTLRRAGIAASALVVIFLLADAASQLFVIPPVLAGAARIGFPVSAGLWQAIGAVLLASTILYAIPRTSFLGAVLVTGYLGGAVCSHVRMGDDVLVPSLICAVVAAFAWGGLALRDARLRALVMGR